MQEVAELIGEMNARHTYKMKTYKRMREVN